MVGWAGDWGEWRRELAAAAVFGLFLGAIGPFGTFVNGAASVRVAYWVGILLVGTAVYGLGVRGLLRLGERFGQPLWFVLPAAVAIVSIPMSLISSTVVLALWPGVRPYMHPADWYAQAVLLGLPLNLLAIWARRALPAHRGRAALSVAPQPAPERSFLHRLPPRLGRNLLCLRMEDHYVRAHTDRGSDLMLIPLKAAIGELDAVEGMQVHRSWWVARAAVTGVTQRDRKLLLKLSNGMEVPVARTAVAALRANHWLDSHPASQS